MSFLLNWVDAHTRSVLESIKIAKDTNTMLVSHIDGEVILLDPNEFEYSYENGR